VADEDVKGIGVPPGTVIRRRWVDLPDAARGVPLAELGEALASHQVVREAWLAGDLRITPEGEERTGLAIACVVDDPSAGHRENLHVETMDLLAPIAARLGLEIQVWAWVAAETAQRSVRPHGVRFFPALSGRGSA
jgi:hypothetical protein